MENKKIPFQKTFFTIIASAIIGIVLSGLTAFAVPPTSKYAPGATLTPNCLPGSTNCTIVPLAASGANTDITSLASLTTTTWSTGAAITAASYQIGRDADATNQLHFNVPTGAGYEWSVNDVGFATWSPTQLLFTQATATTGNPLAFSVTGANNTTLTNSDQVEAQFDFVQTKQFTGAAGATTIDNAYGLGIGGSTYQTAGAGALTITNGATFYISKAPTTTAGGGGTTITNSLALLVDEGKVRFDGGGTSGQASAAGGLLEMKASTINGNNASGTIAIGTPVSIGITTYTNNNATLTMTNAASLYIAGSPVASTNVTFTQAAYALWVQTGVTSLSGGTRFNNTTTIPAGNIEPHQFFNTTAANTGVVMSLANTSTAGYASINFYDTDTISLTGGFGFGNATSYFASKVFFSANSREMIFTANNATTHLSLAAISGNAAFSAGALSSGVQTYFKITAPASTGQTAATEVVGLDFDLDATKTWATGAGPLATQREVLFRAPTYAGGVAALTMTDAYTVYITGAPIAGANMTITRPWGLGVSGNIGAGNGTAALPSFSFIGDPDTGVFLSAANTVALSAGNSGLLTLDVTGEVLTNGTFTIPAAGKFKVAGENTFILRPASNTLGFSTEDIERVRITSSQTRIINRLSMAQGADVASASTIALGSDGNSFEITGITQINLILNTNWQNGSKVTLVFNESVTVAHAQTTSGSNITILLAGAVNFAATANDTLTLVLSETTAGGQAWREEARSVI